MMRLSILEKNQTLAAKALFTVIRIFSGSRAVDAVRLVAYRPDFYGNPMKRLTHSVMRGPSAWSVADRELMAAFVSKLNDCEFCINAHSAVASRAFGDKAKVAAILADLETAPIEEPLRAVLRMLGKLTREQRVGAEDVRAAMTAGASSRQIEEALGVCFVFNTMNRLAETLNFAVPGPEVFEAGAKFLLSRGYR